jgi:glutaredoxin 3
MDRESMAQAEIYTTAICAYCVAAKNFLKNRGCDYIEVRVDREPGKLDEMLRRSAGRRSVPQVFINGAHVGGYDDLVAAERSGRLKELLESAPADTSKE